MKDVKDCIYRKEATEFIDKCLNHEEELQSVERETWYSHKPYIDFYCAYGRKKERTKM